MRAENWPLGVLAVVLACALGTAAPAAEHESAAEPESAAKHEAPGEATFRQYCGACHGVFGDGKGPVAPVLKAPPRDLRQLGRKYGMPLPRPKLIELIDGREMARAHGTSDMPVWGDKLLGDVPPSAAGEPFKRGTMLVIIDYLESIQVAK